MITVQFVDRNAILTAMTAAGGPFDPSTMTVFPYIAPVTQSTRLTKSEIMALAATYAGSGAIGPVIWGSHYRDGSDNVYVDSQLFEFIATADPATAETVYGLAWDLGATICIDPLPAPIKIEKAGDAVRYIATLPFGQ